MREQFAHDANSGAIGGFEVSIAPDRRRSFQSLFWYGPMLVVVALALADSQRFADPDLWGHLRFGQAVLASGRIARQDVYSYSAMGHGWINHEWLSEVLMAFMYQHLGVFGLKLLKLVCSAAIVGFTTLAVGETGASFFWQFATLITISISIAPEIQFRPQMFTLALFAATMMLLARDCYRREAALWLMVPLLALWANLHGGFIVGIGALAAYAAVTTGEDFIQGRDHTHSIHVMLVAVAATMATLLNPFGIGMWRGVAHALSNPHTRDVIIDWLPLLVSMRDQWRMHPSGTAHFVLALILYASFVGLVIRVPKDRDWPIISVAAVMMGGAFLAVRNYPLAELALAAPLARRIGLIAHDWPAVSSRHGLLNSAVLGTVAVAIFAFSGLFSSRIVSQDRFPAGAVGYIRNHHLKGNILAPFDWGEYLIWHLHPDNPVFVDGRYDTVYPSSVIDDYLAYHFNRPGADAVLSRYPHDLILVDRKMPALRMVESHLEWVPIYQDKACVLFARTSLVAGKPDHRIATGAPSSDFP